VDIKEFLLIKAELHIQIPSTEPQRLNTRFLRGHLYVVRSWYCAIELENSSSNLGILLKVRGK